MGGLQTILICDHVNLGIPITKEVHIQLYNLIKFEDTYHNIYSKLIHAQILETVERKPNMMSKSWIKFKEVCYYYRGMGGTTWRPVMLLIWSWISQQRMEGPRQIFLHFTLRRSRDRRSRMKWECLHLSMSQLLGFFSLDAVLLFCFNVMDF